MLTAGGVADTTGFGFQEEEFFLVIMTEFMVKMTKRYGSLLAIDATHNTTPYGFKLITLMVVDPATNSGYPVAYCLAPSEKEKCIKAFLQTVKVFIISRASLEAIIDINTLLDDGS